MSLYGLSLSNDPEYVIWACLYGNSLHPGYHQCQICDKYNECPNPFELRIETDDEDLDDSPHFRKD